MRLRERTVIVTGAASGIGRAIAVRFAAAGAVVGVADRDGAGIQATIDLIRSGGEQAIPLRLDITDRATVDHAVAEFRGVAGHIDVLVNNAALTASQDAADDDAADDDEADDDEAAWDAMLAGSLRGAYSCTRAVLPAMLARGSGVIVNISSVNALVALGDDAYSAAKAGLISLTRNVAVRYGRHGIRANVICPGTIRTPAWERRLGARPDVLARVAALYPIGRVGEPGDVAAAALFLASDEASFITGAVLAVDGGLTAGIPQFAGIVAAPGGRRDEPAS